MTRITHRFRLTADLRSTIYLFCKCCSRCRFQPYDCVIVRFVE